MIRIEGIPIVAARLAEAQKSKAIEDRKQSRRRSKIAAGKAPLAVRRAA